MVSRKKQDEKSEKRKKRRDEMAFAGRKRGAKSVLSSGFTRYQHLVAPPPPRFSELLEQGTGLLTDIWGTLPGEKSETDDECFSFFSPSKN